MDFSKQLKPLQKETDWPMWKRKIRDILDYHEGAIDVIDRVLLKPTPLSASSSPEEIRLFKINSDLFRKANSYAKSMIISAVSDEIYEKIMDQETAADTWDALKSQFEANSKDQVFKICIDFFQFTWNDNLDVSMHTAKLKTLWSELNNGLRARKENVLPDLLLVCKILQILPHQFETFKSSWMLLSKNEEKTFDEMATQLCMFQRNFGGSESKSSEEVLALRYSKSKKAEGSQKLPTNRDKRSDTCNYCKKKGHWVKDCRKWVSDGKPNKSRTGEVKSMVHETLHVFCDEANAVQDTRSDDWWIDNGATRHVCNKRGIFKDFEMFEIPCNIRAAGKEILEAVGKGTITMDSIVNNNLIRIELCDVWYVPEINRNLFSVLMAHDQERSSEFKSTATNCTFIANNKVMLVGSRQIGGTLFKANIKAIVPKDNEVNSLEDNNLLQLYHERWGHQDKRHVKKLLSSILNIDVKMNNSICEPCIYGKSHRRPFGHRDQTTYPGELISADVCGPFVESFSKQKYLLIFKDAYTKYRYGYLLRQKSEVKDALETVLNLMKTQGHPAKELLTDNGGEFDNSEVLRILNQYGVTQRLTAPYTPQQNGGSERENRTVIEMARTFRHSNKQAEFPDEIWAELVRTSIYILNRTGKSSIDGKSPYELWIGKKPRIKHLKVIGCECFAHIPSQKRKKMDSKAVKGYLIGYDEEERYRIFNKDTQSLILSRDVKFNEIVKNCEAKKLENNKASEDIRQFNPPFIRLDQETQDEENSNRDDIPIETLDEISEESEYNSFNENQEEGSSVEEIEDDSDVEEIYGRKRLRESDEESDEETDHITKRLRDRTQITNSKYDDYIMISEDLVNGIEIPLTYDDAIKSTQSIQWKEAMKSEMTSLQENKTWIKESLPKGAKALPSKWVYKVKMNPDGSIDKYKARLVIKGFTQREGIDYNETFSPVARLGTIRAVLSIAANQNMPSLSYSIGMNF